MSIGDIMNKRKCLNVIVYYNNYDEVVQYLSEVEVSGRDIVDVAIVVNNDAFNKLADLKQLIIDHQFNNVQIFDLNDNVGYLNSLFYVIKMINLSCYKYIILSNTDIHYPNQSFYRVLLNKKYSDNIGCIAPSVYTTKTDSYSNPHYLERINKEKFVRLNRIFRYPFIARIYLKLAYIKASKNKKHKKESCFTYSPHGCFMIFTYDFIHKIIGYKYGVRMYSEESCIGELLQRCKMKCYYDSTIEIEHRENSVTGKINYKKRFAMWNESIEYILKEFY